MHRPAEGVAAGIGRKVLAAGVTIVEEMISSASETVAERQVRIFPVHPSYAWRHALGDRTEIISDDAAHSTCDRPHSIGMDQTFLEVPHLVAEAADLSSQTSSFGGPQLDRLGPISGGGGGEEPIGFFGVQCAIWQESIAELALGEVLADHGLRYTA